MDIKAYKKSYFGEKLPGIVAVLEKLINEMDFDDPKTQDNIRSINKDKIVIHVGPDKLKTKYSYDLIGNINEYLSERKVAASSCAILTNVDRAVYAAEADSLDLTYDISNL